MIRSILVVSLILLASVCRAADDDAMRERKADAERYFRGVYSGNTAVIDELAADNITITYPIFATLFGQSCVRGRDAVKAFVAHFARKWTEAEITIHEVVAEHDTVALIWSVRAHDAMASPADGSATDEKNAWGGITVLHFDADGRIAAEIGEESEPGPMARIQDGAAG